MFIRCLDGEQFSIIDKINVKKLIDVAEGNSLANLFKKYAAESAPSAERANVLNVWLAHSHAIGLINLDDMIEMQRMIKEVQ